MPGHNHYSWCGCGWCVKYASERSKPTPKRDPWSEQAGLYGSRSCCFVQPNATCPVCGQLVFYYQNSYGSRVFFDELGWPWPKHPCTDNRSKADTRGTSPVVRPLEIIRLAKQKCSDEQIDVDGNFLRRFGTSPPELVVLEAQIVRGNRRHLRVRHLDSSKVKSRAYLSLPASTKLADGSICSIKGNILSWIDEEFQPIEIGIKFIPASEY